MRTPNFPIGPASLCLLLLAGCASAPPSPAPQIIVTGCPAVVPCRLPPAAPIGNGELLRDAEVVEAAWADCAAQVDTVYQAQQKAPRP
ncbi:Rz1-like lysis system protein LysC [Pseudomonas sp. BJa5]|uniref:Rz1-like lysis system protein LysC n=1 Tax=Pseudomonas sp. BJa5 TaxID=2936270 RepID=UPI00255A0E9F|nr:Rz1-like lysis system protein LysC [Pseudomonas sp. BGr12]MDL2419612.1 Rz1-like lysis system protein LysC [Pseudomonas sp. BGr12]